MSEVNILVCADIATHYSPNPVDAPFSRSLWRDMKPIFDSVDFRLVNLVQAGDITITQDYGLAAMCLSKNVIVLNQDGKRYTDDNIRGLLEFRAVSAKIRRSDGRTKGMSKRTAQQDKDFEKALEEVIRVL